MSVTIVFKLCLGLLFLLQLRHAMAGFFYPKRVDLSNRDLHNQDFFLKLQYQHKLSEVTELILRGNRFDSFVDCSTSLDNLRVLDLSHNNLKQFFMLCIGEDKLVSLNVSHNQIEYIGDSALSYRTMQLKVLDVSFNDIYVVNDTMLQHMKNLEFLSLASNPIVENMDSYVFQNLTKLKHLDLRNISCPYFSPALFETLVNLEYLDLSNNPIEDIPPLPTNLKILYISGTNMVHLGTFVMPQLIELSLENSPNLTSVLLNNFENLTHLEILSMQNSPRLSQIRIVTDPEGELSSHLLPRLKRLHLQNCALETLDKELLPIIQRTAVVDLQNNPWRCDCKMKWLNAINLTTDLVNSFRCQSPPWLHNNLLHNISSWDLICENPIEIDFDDSDDANNILYPILWTSILLFMLGLAAGLIYYSRGCLGQLAMKMRHRATDTVSYTNVVESSNDLVRILPVGETNETNDA